MVGVGLIMSNWNLKLTSDFWPVFVLWNAVPWVLFLVARLVRYVAEGFFNENA
jgi:hypothetical protein